MVWAGAEPTVLGTFDRTTDFLTASRVRQAVQTSGIRFSLPVEKALRKRLASACISVDSGTNETYRFVKRNPNADAVWESIRRYSATRGDVVVKYILFHLNSEPREVEVFIDRCVDAGVRHIRISVDARSVFGDGHGAHPITEKELIAAAMMRNLAVSQGIAADMETIWTSDQLDRIGEIGDFNAHRKPSRLDRIRRITSVHDVALTTRLAVVAAQRKIRSI